MRIAALCLAVSLSVAPAAGAQEQESQPTEQTPQVEQPAADQQEGAKQQVATEPQGKVEQPTPVVKDAPKLTDSAPLPEPDEDVPATTVQTGINEIRAGDVTAAIKLNARVSGAVQSAYPLDTDLEPVNSTPVDVRFRISPEIHYGALGLVAEADVYSGLYGGLPQDTLGLGATPYAVRRPLELRQAFVEYKGATWVMRLGQQASQWGLGLVANGGNEDAAPGDFGDAHFGDLSYRALVAGRPLYGFGGAWRAIEPAVAFEVVSRDDTANFGNGDRALQGVAALRFAVDADRNFGLYTVYRHQRAVGNDPELRATDALVLDLAGKWSWERWGVRRSLGLEAAYITGTTTQARNAEFPRQDVRQFGAALKGSLAFRRWTGLFDAGWASGDQNPYDSALQNFRFDPDYHVGFILYDQVLGMMSARTSSRAADPNLVGVPQDGVELLPTRGSVTGSQYLYPRVRVAAREWLDVYGGPLFAWTTARWVDPYAARIDGGSTVNSLGGRAGSFLGTELDFGAQGRWRPRENITLSATLELGGFVPGDAFTTSTGELMAPVASGRLRLAAQL